MPRRRMWSTFFASGAASVSRSTPSSLRFDQGRVETSLHPRDQSPKPNKRPTKELVCQWTTVLTQASRATQNSFSVWQTNWEDVRKTYRIPRSCGWLQTTRCLRDTCCGECVCLENQLSWIWLLERALGSTLNMCKAQRIAMASQGLCLKNLNNRANRAVYHVWFSFTFACFRGVSVQGLAARRQVYLRHVIRIVWGQLLGISRYPNYI